jgi:hypothetical protein
MRIARLLPILATLATLATLASAARAAEPAHGAAAHLPAPPAPKAATASGVQPPAAPGPKPAALPSELHLLKHAAAPAAAAKSANTLHGAAPAPARFPASRISTGDAAKLRALVVSGRAGAAEAANASSGAAPVDKVIADNVHLLMSAGPDAYEHVMVTPSHVALVRRSGIVDLVSHADAKAQIATGKPHENKRVQLGIGPRGFPLWGEDAPNGSLRLYRQLPVTAKGEVPSIDEFTSFALTGDDAFHPWGEAGQTVTITIPHELLDRITTGELGGTGWRGLGGIAIDVAQEVQIDTKVLKAHLAGNWKDALKK